MLTDPNTTICAVATPPGAGAIGVIRVAGPQTFEIVDRLFKATSGESIRDLPGYIIRHGHIVDPSNDETIDEVLVSLFRAPKSYTGEDVIEISCHGGPVILARIMSVLTANGCIEAQPGEFTLRAFINGRIDLSEAEGIAELIAAKTESSAFAAVEMMTGALRAFIEPIREDILRARTQLEMNIDFTEEDVDPAEISGVRDALIELVDRLSAMSRTYERGRILRDGFRVALAGPPNAGKSTLFNRLAQDERAIVTDIPGTTRDTLMEYVNVEGIPICLIDTAGIRESADIIEQAGIERAQVAAHNADLVLWLSAPDTGGIPTAPPESWSDIDAPKWPLMTKCDLPQADSTSDGPSQSSAWSQNPLAISARTGVGIEELLAAIAAESRKQMIDDAPHSLCINDRHRRLITSSVESLNQAITGLVAEQPPELVAEDLRTAGDHLAEIVGAVSTEDVLAGIFSQFCIGK